MIERCLVKLQLKMDWIERFSEVISKNKWHRYFYTLCRLLLSYAFIVAGVVKIVGERFASGLSELHPMGAFLTALHETGFYYTFIGIVQLIAGVLLVIRRTAVLGALIYFPIILNICVLSIAVRFEGSLFTTPLMVLANGYILAWNYPKWKFIVPWINTENNTSREAVVDSRFPIGFFSVVLASVLGVYALAQYGFDIVPRNSKADCFTQYVGTVHEAAAREFCECVHDEGTNLDQCLENFQNSKARPN